MTDDELTAVDRDALERALALAKTDRPEQIARMLSEDPWLEAASFASFHCQCRSLQLRPWNSPPCFGHVRTTGGRLADPAAYALAERLEAAGLSIFEPDPIGALQAIEARPPAA